MTVIRLCSFLANFFSSHLLRWTSIGKLEDRRTGEPVRRDTIGMLPTCIF